MNLEALARTLADAAADRSAVPQLSREYDLDLADAYAVQRLVVDARKRARTGVKLGLTSRAKAVQMGVFDVIIGELTEDMAVADGGRLDPGRFIHPRVEPEIAFLLRGGEVAAVAPALEIIDSRYRDFRFNLVDVVADNTSAAAYVLGPWRAADTDTANRGVVMEIDGRVAETGSTAAILGDPWRAVETAARLARATGLHLPDETVVLAGAATAAAPLTPGSTVEARVSTLGRVSFTFDA
ncbi:4-oxalocrotonate decarboxylase [Streptomyces sp. J2-1]|uniref:2-keto-4-pentenoate hydratase n=1 Tax=Streptomyces corallincola TaxID=2851888 RepID=UPI001C394E29|nr:fumarylacetoacetate hydrolase family protein [Streptomyces corallincola]MBV2355434.1 4-oxalocrotonate decarboxylase [Streptomyces corallincola]